MNQLKKYLYDGFMIVTSFGSILFHMLLILFILSLNLKVLALHLFLGIVIIYSIVFIFRTFYFKQRPIKESYTNLFTKLNASSFPSLHSMSSIFVAFVLSNHFKNIFTTILLAIIVLLVAYSRIYIKKHYLIDVICGLIFGAIFGIIYLVLF